VDYFLFADQAGTGGEFEVPCPVCGDPVAFEYMDLDGRGLEHARLCDCGALAMLSSASRASPSFRRFELETRGPVTYFSAATGQADEYGNPVYVHGARPAEQ
jgi:hypothetical protein